MQGRAAGSGKVICRCGNNGEISERRQVHTVVVRYETKPPGV